MSTVVRLCDGALLVVDAVEGVFVQTHAFTLLSNSSLMRFSAMQVSTAVRLCDGALVVVDAVEGVCVQTHAVMKQAWAERVTPTLVINKLDRLITELELDAQQAYERLARIVDEANGVFASLASVEFLQTADELAEDAAFECALRVIVCEL